MKPKWFLALFGVLLAAPAFADSRAYYDLRFGITNAPGMVLFDRCPDVVLVPRTRVYVVEDAGPYDVYRYGDSWYACRGDRWYRSSHYRSAFRPVHYRSVPRAVRYVPAYGGRHVRYEHRSDRWDRDRRGDRVAYRSHRGDRWDDRGGKRWDRGDRDHRWSKGRDDRGHRWSKGRDDRGQRWSSYRDHRDLSSGKHRWKKHGKHRDG